MLNCVNATVKIKNIPDYDISKYAYIIVTLVEGELWYYGAYKDINDIPIDYDNKMLLNNPMYKGE